MVEIRSIETGKILGYAANAIVAYEMAKTNGWRNWFIETPAVADEPSSGDPRDSTRGVTHGTERRRP